MSSEKNNSKNRRQYENSEWKKNNVLLILSMKGFISFLFSINAISPILSQEDTTFSIALYHLIAISLMLLLCKYSFSLIFLCYNKMSAMEAANQQIQYMS